MAAFHHPLRAIGAAIIQRFEQTPREGFENFMALKKVAYFDIGVIVDGIVFERERLIDSRVANHLMRTVTAAKLMGAVVVVAGGARAKRAASWRRASPSPPSASRCTSPRPLSC